MAEKKKILLVDDDPDFVEAVRVIVESGGYQVRVAYDGQEGLDAVAEEKPDLSPQEIKGIPKFSAEEVFALFEKIPGLIIIDSRLATGPSSGRANGFIEGSISLPDIKTDCASLAKAIPKMNAPSLFYCDGPKCGGSAKAIQIAV